MSRDEYCFVTVKEAQGDESEYIQEAARTAEEATHVKKGQDIKEIKIIRVSDVLSDFILSVDETCF